jgi:hypothetical protein
MRVKPFVAQRCTLFNPKPVLLVYYSHAEILQLNIFLYDSVCTHQNINLS